MKRFDNLVEPKSNEWSTASSSRKMEPTPLLSLLFNFHDKLIPIYWIFSSVKQKVVKMGKKTSHWSKKCHSNIGDEDKDYL